MVAGQVYISGAVESWTVAGSFGQRRFVALTPLLTLGLAAVLVTISPGLTASAKATASPPTQSRGRTRPPLAARAVLAATLALCIWWNVGLIAQFGLHRMDRQRLSLGENARQTFLVLPRELPGLALRYLTDRDSFYRLPRE
jgi:hypothetical protein